VVNYIPNLPNVQRPSPERASRLYRGTFLELYLSPSQQAAWKESGDLVFHSLLAIGGPNPAIPGATLRPGLQAVAKDLSYLAEFLRSLGAGAELPPQDQALQTLAALAARQIAGVAAGLKIAALQPRGSARP